MQRIVENAQSDYSAQTVGNEVTSPFKDAEWSVTEQNDWVPWVKGGGGSAKFWDLRSDFRDFLGLKVRKCFYCLFAPQAQHYWLEVPLVKASMPRQGRTSLKF